jgi:SagB-type dehydrogenase family enzyme
VSSRHELYQAAGLGRSVSLIEEISLPQRPRFVADLLCLPYRGAVHIVGGENQSLGGTSADWLFTSLVPELDGATTVAELHDRFRDLPPQALDDVLYLLRMHGLLEEGPPADDPRIRDLESRYGKQMAFFSRYLRVTGRHANRYEVQASLGQAAVLVLGDENLAASIASELRLHGVGRVGFAREDEGEPHRHWDLVIYVAPLERQLHAMRVMLDRRLPTLFVDAVALVLGPLTEPRITACPGCVRHQLRVESDDPASISPLVHAMWSRGLEARAVQRALCHITHLYQADRYAEVEVIRPALGRATTYESILCLPNCSVCGSETPHRAITFPTGHRDNAALLYHRNTRLKPSDLGHPSEMQHHLSPEVTRLTRTAFLDRGGTASVPFPELDGSAVDSALAEYLSWEAPDDGRRGSCDAAALGAILGFSGGGNAVKLSDGQFHFLRYAASGGNLGSAELYPIVRNADRVPPGIYHYSLLGHSLSPLPRGVDPEGDAAKSDLGLDDDSDVSIVIVSDVERVFAKYGGRAYVYCLLDAGVMAHRLQLIARAVGLQSRLVWVFDDAAVSQVLGVSSPFAVPACIVELA